MPSASLSLLISVQLIISIDSTYLIRSIAILMLDFNSYISLISLSLLLAYSNACLVHIIGTRKKYLGFIESYTGWLNRRRFIYLILNWMTQLEEVQCLGNVSGKNFEPSGNNVCFFFPFSHDLDKWRNETESVSSWVFVLRGHIHLLLLWHHPVKN